jgi:uncharacterized protein involved in copper resistance
MNRYGLAAIASAALLLAACGGKDTMASKSAAAYREALAKGTQPTSGQEHGGHATTEAGTGEGMNHATMTGMDHSQMAGMDHSQMPGTDHSKMDHSQMAHSQMTGMDHSTMSGMDHSKMDHSQMDHSKMSGTDHSAMAGMDHSKMTGMDHSTMAGVDHSKMTGMDHSQMQHGAAAAASGAVNVTLDAPNTNAEMARTQPATTLQSDAWDAPAPSAVSETQKAAGGGGHKGHGSAPPRKE